ncbi:MAG: TolC family protein [Bacteroidales bacterium]|nr:TolC family protein [Bacteroidales bacterium]
MKRIIIITGLLIYNVSFAQSVDKVTLKDCYTNAVNNYPLKKQFDLYKAYNELQRKNLNATYLPSVDVNGQASYQSDVTQVPIHVPGLEIPVISKDWYKLTLDVNQVIYDGGTTGKQKILEDINLQINEQNVEIELYKLKERVNQVYFRIILLKENKKILQVFEDEIKSKLKNVISGVENGVLLQKDADILQAELIKIEQQITEVEIGINAGISILNELTSLKLSDNTEFVLPEITINTSLFENKRLEYELMGLQQHRINAMKNVVTTKNLPRLFGFGQLGYGRPGLDMLSDDFESFYIFGAKLNWNLWNWNQNKTEKKILDLQNNIITTQKETFDKNLKIELENKIAEIKRYEELLKKDAEIIDLRSRIAKTASSQLDNGVITSTDYVTELTAEASAKLSYQTHKIQLINAKLNYLSAKGEL